MPAAQVRRRCSLVCSAAHAADQFCGRALSLPSLHLPSAAARAFTSAPQALGAAIGTAAIVAIIASETKRRWVPRLI